MLFITSNFHYIALSNTRLASYKQSDNYINDINVNFNSSLGWSHFFAVIFIAYTNLIVTHIWGGFYPIIPAETITIRFFSSV